MSAHRLILGDPEIELRVRRSPRARRLALRIDPRHDQPELVLPRGVSLEEGRRFAAGRAQWLRRRLSELPPRIPFAAGSMIPVLGVPHRVRHEPGARGGVRRAAGELIVSGPVAEHPRRLEAWLKAEARRLLGARARSAAARLGRDPPPIGVRDPATRWGSCSARGRLSFSWRLVMAPEAVLDYVVAHEVAHLEHANHGPRFWRLVDELCPGRGEARRWLRRHGAALHRHG